MGETIHAVGDLFREFGMIGACLIVAVSLIVVVLLVHIQMLKQWGTSNKEAAAAWIKLAEASETRTQNVERRQDSLQVLNANLQNKLVQVNDEQNASLKELVAAGKSAATKVEEQAVQNKEVKDLLVAIKESTEKTASVVGSDPDRMCRIARVLKAKFPLLTDDELALSVQKYVIEHPTSGG